MAMRRNDDRSFFSSRFRFGMGGSIGQSGPRSGMIGADDVLSAMRSPAIALAGSLALFVSLGAAPAVASAAGDRPAPPWGTGDSRGDDLRVTLITFGPGSEVASLFGHSALYVEDTARHEGRVYNYGMFSFDRTLLVRYALGKLTFWLGESSIERTLRIYRAQNREIVAQ